MQPSMNGVAKKNGLTRNSSVSPRTSPKIFKAQQQQQQQPMCFKAPDGQYLANNYNKPTVTNHHSITVSTSQSPQTETPLNQKQQQQQLQQQQNASQLNHVALTCENVNNNVTGIKQGPLKSTTAVSSSKMDNVRKVKKLNGTLATTLKKTAQFAAKRVSAVKARSKTIAEPIWVVPQAPEVQAASICLQPDAVASEQQIHFQRFFSPLSQQNQFDKVPREKRLSEKLMHLERLAMQSTERQKFRTASHSKMRFRKALKMLQQLDRSKEEM